VAVTRLSMPLSKVVIVDLMGISKSHVQESILGKHGDLHMVIVLDYGRNSLEVASLGNNGKRKFVEEEVPHGSIHMKES
jgi:hypothetical protein